MLILVVGPSGAGKDTLLEAARAALDGDPRFRFARRSITRDATPGGEDHQPVSQAAFECTRAADGFFLSWEAHGLGYGIPADVADDLAAGRVVVASVSRSVIDAARRRAATRVVEITAPADLLATRLAARGREGAPEIAARLARTVARPSDGATIVISNDGTIAEGAARLIAELRRAAEP